MNSGEEILQCQCMQMRAADSCAPMALVGVYSGLAGRQSYMKHRKMLGGKRTFFFFFLRIMILC